MACVPSRGRVHEPRNHVLASGVSDGGGRTDIIAHICERWYLAWGRSVTDNIAAGLIRTLDRRRAARSG